MDHELSPEVEALQQAVLRLTSESITWQARAIDLQRQLEALRKEEPAPMRVVGGAA